MPSNIETTKKAYELFLRGDIQGLIAEHLAETCRYVIPGIREKMPWVGTYKQQVGEFFQRMSEGIEFTAWDNRELLETGDTVVVIGASKGRSKATGREFVAEFAHVLKYDAQGKLVMLQDYHDTAQIAAAMG